MTRLTPVSWREFVTRMHELGFEGPYTGGKHLLMIRGNVRIIIPNPHQGDINVDLLKRLLRVASITREEWLQSQ